MIRTSMSSSLSKGRYWSLEIDDDDVVIIMTAMMVVSLNTHKTYSPTKNAVLLGQWLWCSW